MTRRASSCYWLCRAAVLTLALQQTVLVDGFSLVATTTMQKTSRPLRKQTLPFRNKNKPVVVRLGHKRKPVAFLSAETRSGGVDTSSAIKNEDLVEMKNLASFQQTAASAAAAALVQAPPVSFDKFLTMQDKRVVVTVQYSGDSGLRPYFLTVAKKLKASHPDVIIERRILAEAEGSTEATFEVLVDGKVAVGKGHSQKQKVARVDMSKTRSVYVSMQELDLAISRARRRRRPNSVVYGATSPTNTDAMESSSSSANGRW
jgi:hypothetical protein